MRGRRGSGSGSGSASGVVDACVGARGSVPTDVADATEGAAAAATGVAAACGPSAAMPRPGAGPAGDARCRIGALGPASWPAPTQKASDRQPRRHRRRERRSKVGLCVVCVAWRMLEGKRPRVERARDDPRPSERPTAQSRPPPALSCFSFLGYRARSHVGRQAGAGAGANANADARNAAAFRRHTQSAASGVSIPPTGKEHAGWQPRAVVSVERFGVMLSRGASCAGARCGDCGGLWRALRLFYRGPSGPECRAELEREPEWPITSLPSHVARARILSERGEPKLGSIRIQRVGAWIVFGPLEGEGEGVDGREGPSCPDCRARLWGFCCDNPDQGLQDCKCSRIGSTCWVWTPKEGLQPVPPPPSRCNPSRCNLTRLEWAVGACVTGRDKMPVWLGLTDFSGATAGSSSWILPRCMHNTDRSGKARNVEFKV